MSTTKPNENINTKFNFPSQSGGKAAIERILEAYGFKNRQALCNHLGVSQSTMANRYMRDNFPADWILTCSLDTGASLLWLATGQGEMNETVKVVDNTVLKRINISNGIKTIIEPVTYDSKLLPETLSSPFVVNYDKKVFIVDAYEGEVTDGLWLIEMDELASIRELNRLPGNRIRVENGKASFECKAEDIKVLGKVVARTEYL